jgi:tetratricopeptide (TPR) repeat protein
VRGGFHNNLGNLLLRASRYEEALTQYERALALKQRALGPEDSDVASTLFNLGLASQYLGRYAAALEQQERSLALREKTRGPGPWRWPPRPGTTTSAWAMGRGGTSCPAGSPATGRRETRLPLDLGVSVLSANEEMTVH